MEDTKVITFRCLTHKRTNEIYCTACNTYLCPECISYHNTPKHKPRYVHVLQYAKSHTLPKIDFLTTATEAFGIGKESEVIEFLTQLKKLVSLSAFDVKVQIQRLSQLKALLQNLRSYLTQSQDKANQESIVKELNTEKKRIEVLMKEKNIAELIRIIQKIEEGVKLTRKQERAKDLVELLKVAAKPMEDINVYNKVMIAVNILNTKCIMYKQEQISSEWKCDEKYLSSKMSLSEDGLTYGNTASNGYPAIIGDLPFDSGVYVFEVTPNGLDCTSKEGFGIIDKEKYLKAYNTDNITPTAYSDMIGFFHKNEVRRMTAKKKNDMQMNKTYTVKVNIPELWVTITGPGTNLKGTLDAGVVYYPCFSCGCSSNKFKIKPLAYVEE